MNQDRDKKTGAALSVSVGQEAAQCPKCGGHLSRETPPIIAGRDPGQSWRVAASSDLRPRCPHCLERFDMVAETVCRRPLALEGVVAEVERYEIDAIDLHCARVQDALADLAPEDQYRVLEQVMGYIREDVEAAIAEAGAEGGAE